MHDNRRRQIHPTALILLAQLASQIERLPYKPPVTLGLVVCVGCFRYQSRSHIPETRLCSQALQVFLHYFDVPELYTNIRDVCLLPTAIVAGRNPLKRLLLSGLLHGSDTHLYYNMVRQMLLIS